MFCLKVAFAFHIQQATLLATACQAYVRRATRSRAKPDLFFEMETGFYSAASHGLVPKDPNDDEGTKLPLCHIATFIKPSQDPTLPSPDHSR